jgi:glycogen synthase
MRILHVLDHSLPYFSGYSFRSSYIINTQRQIGLIPFVVTSPKHENFSASPETLNEVEYHRVRWPGFHFLPAPRQFPLLRHSACISALATEITRLARELKIDVIHAHSPSLNGLAAGRAARKLKLPWLYELRYYEEDAAVDRGKIRYHSPRYRLAQMMEQKALEAADVVVTIASSLRADLIRRGIPAEKIFESPNGVDTSIFSPRPPDQEIIAKHHLAGKTVIGFIGSFYAYEGLDRLVDAVLLLLRERQDLKLLLAGEGEMEAKLRAQIPDSLREHFVFAGKVPHADVRRYYSVMDMLAYPRISSRLTELTTPLKPLEAMAMERAVIGSDIGGIGELIQNNKTGALIMPEDLPALAACIARLADQPEERLAIGKRARELVVQTRDWRRIVERYPVIYEKLLAGQRRRN